MVVIVLLALMTVGSYCFVKHRLKKRTKIKRLRSNKTRLLDRLERNWKKSLERQGVNGLDEMPAEWRHAIIPKESQEGKELAEQLLVMAKQILAATNASPVKRSQLRNRVGDYIARHMAPFLAYRSQLYRDKLRTDPTSTPKTKGGTTRLFKQIILLLFDLDNMFKRSYEQRFDLRVVSEMGKWNEWAQQRHSESGAIVLKQSTSNLFDLYCQAAQVHAYYNAVFRRLAKKTGAEWVPASLKKIFRILEKAVKQKAESHMLALKTISEEPDSVLSEEPGSVRSDEPDSASDEDDKAEYFDCCRVLDIVRGTLVYKSLAEGTNCLLGGIRALYDSKEFQVLRLKDRFNNPTSACWRDVLVNGRMVANNGTVLPHIVEVQFHHKDLRQERLMVAGHVIYERHRALLEACELACGSELTMKIMERIHMHMRTRRRSRTLDQLMNQKTPHNRDSWDSRRASVDRYRAASVDRYRRALMDSTPPSSYKRASVDRYRTASVDSIPRSSYKRASVDRFRAASVDSTPRSSFNRASVDRYRAASVDSLHTSSRASLNTNSRKKVVPDRLVFMS